MPTSRLITTKLSPSSGPRKRSVTANIPCGGIFPADEISMYKTMRVDPINPKYRIPSSACAERMAPEFPAGIVYSSIKPRRPHAIGNVVFRPPGRTGRTNDAAPIAALANQARKTANTQRRRDQLHARIVAVLPCDEAWDGD